ncbi:hypothetical protein [Absidia glauca]|uniref:Cyclin-domain-containing protein n=1 Tax=Absidia glauca TaxID=4829 RepID=A0A168SPU5_ABSGL|nr:hypothetical protein [Absidia glauca]
MLSPTFDLAQHPTGDTIRLLASLLERMTNANDQLNKATHSARKGTTSDMRRSSSASPLGSSSNPTQMIPTTTATTVTAATNNTSTTTTTTTTSTVVNGNTNENVKNGSGSTNYTLFHARSIPSIDIYSYLSRILKYCPCANECFLSLLVYFDRMSKNALALTGQPFTIDSYNIHRLIISGVMVSSKFFSDIFYTNTRYAKVGGLPVSELNRLELEFLQLNGYNISVSINELQRYGDQLLKVGLMEQEMRMLYDSSPSSYTIRHGRSTSLGSTALVRTLDGFDTCNQRKSMDQLSVQQLVDGTTKLHLDDNGTNHPIDNTKRYSGSSAGMQQYHQHQPQHQGNKDMYMYATYASPSPPSLSSSYTPVQSNKVSTNGYTTMRRMGSMGSLHSLHQSPLTMATIEEPMVQQQQQLHHHHHHQQQQQQQQSTMTTPPLFVRQQPRFDGNQQQYRYQQRHSFADWPVSSSSSSLTTGSTASPPKSRQRHDSMGLNGTSKPTTEGWRMPRQTRSSVNLYQQHNSIWATTAPTPSVTTPIISVDPTNHPYQHHQQYQYQQHQQQFHVTLQQQQQQQQQFYNPSSGNVRRRLSLTSVHAPPFIPQRPASAEYTSGISSSASFGYPSFQQPIGIPTPPPSSSPQHSQHKSDYHLSSSHQLYL